MMQAAEEGILRIGSSVGGIGQSSSGVLWTVCHPQLGKSIERNAEK